MIQAQPDYFTGLERLSQNGKVTKAQQLFSRYISPLDSARAIPVLNRMLAHAEKEGDAVFEALANGFLGIYYNKCCKHEKKRAVQYFKRGLELSHAHHIRLAEPWLAQQLGLLYYDMGNYPLAFEYLLRANADIQAIGYGNFPQVVSYLHELGRVYYEFGYYRKSIAYLLTALDHIKPANLWYGISINNTLALAYQRLSMMDSAAFYFNKALPYAVKRKDTAWIGIISGNLGYLHYNEKNYEQAMRLLRYDLEISTRYRVWGSAANCLLTFGEFALKSGDLQAASHYVDAARICIQKDDNKLAQYILLYRLQSDIYKREGAIGKAYTYLDSFIMLRDSLTREKDAKVLSQAEAKIETETHLAKLKLLESERSKAIILRNGIVTALVLLIIIVLQVLYRIRQRQKNDRKLFTLGKKRAEDEIHNAQQLLGSYVVSLREKSQLIEKFREEIQKLRTISDSSAREQDEIVEQLHYATILTEADWIEFKRLFVKVHKDFFDILHGKYPDLTQAETRLLALTKLKLSVNEMASMLGISADSVRKTRLRLRKKLHLPEQTNLEDILG